MFNISESQSQMTESLVSSVIEDVLLDKTKPKEMTPETQEFRFRAKDDLIKIKGLSYKKSKLLARQMIKAFREFAEEHKIKLPEETTFSFEIAKEKPVKKNKSKNL